MDAHIKTIVNVVN